MKIAQWHSPKFDALCIQEFGLAPDTKIAFVEKPSIAVMDNTATVREYLQELVLKPEFELFPGAKVSISEDTLFMATMIFASQFPVEVLSAIQCLQLFFISEPEHLVELQVVASRMAAMQVGYYPLIERAFTQLDSRKLEKRVPENPPTS